MSLAISPSPSLLIPPNPSFSSADSAPRGGILINARRESEPLSPRPNLIPLITTPVSPTTPDSSPSISPVEPATATRIRFAPLPDPRRPRSLSTGRNVVEKASEGADGTTLRTIEIRGVVPQVEYDEDKDNDVEYDDDEEGRGRRWSKTMTMGMGSWKGTKKLLGMKEDAYTEGSPLKKSVSTGGFIGSSPFRWSSETERRRSMQGLPPPPLSTVLDTHRRNSSLESPPASLSSSPQPVRMLNGRVYGSRRAIEAADRERRMREQNEPAFVEWGNGKSGAGLSSNAHNTEDRGMLGDGEDGSGMEWVRRRRLERQKKVQEERAAAEASRAGGLDFHEPCSSGSSNGSVRDISPATTKSDLVTPATATSQLPPIIQVSELSPSSSKLLDVKSTEAIQVPRRNEMAPVDTFESDDDDFEDDVDEEEDKPR